jgi:hypothetical protein
MRNICNEEYFLKILYHPTSLRNVIVTLHVLYVLDYSTVPQRIVLVESDMEWFFRSWARK